MADTGLKTLMTMDAVSKGFNGKGTTIHVLKDADFRIDRGETIAVVGASGIGKSTLLNIIGTLDRPDSGSVAFQGQDLFSLGDPALAQFRNTRIGFVFQFHYLLQGFTALENVMIPGLIGRKSKKSIEKQALSMLERVGLGSRLFHRVEDLSGGEQQRVAIARALVMKPDLLLADEPTGNLDQQNGRAVHGLLDELNKELGMTMIVVTHNMKLARMMDRCVTIEDARIIPAE
ncbi:ABC transporter ATP-binding protein [Desulfospira joergensenii]|uniref:ABC transporter ATP-binding protein n=1 Tax=Desulfospira joergensenii TaxID=53329 RepID=UPI0003B7A416|nr:ABC transporter ATP-binding protein [Desulfospira joergensenii]